MRVTITIAGIMFLIACASFAQPAAPRAASAPAQTPPPSAAIATNGPYKIPEGRLLEFPVPLSVSARKSVANAKNPGVEFARAAIAVPPGFEPEIPTPILLVNGTSDGDGSSIRWIRAYTNIALQLGWVVIAADGPMAKPAEDNPPFRWAMVSALLDHMNKAWPGARRWPIVSAGFSGGGKWAGVIGAILSQKDYKLIGVFMGGVNQDLASEAAKLYDPAIRYKQTPFYLSSGSEDKTATPEHHHEVRDSLLQNGFTNVRLESFKGGHGMSETELRKALNWFIEQYGKGAADPVDPLPPAEPK